MEIIINTPYFITENSLDGFTKTENGYTLTRNGLPKGELEFTLSSSENPKKQINPYDIISLVILTAIGAFILICAALLIFGCAVVCIVIVRKIRKKKN